MNVRKSATAVPESGRMSAVVRAAKKVAVAATLAVVAGLPSPALSAGDPVAGAAAFASYCSGCHVASHVPGRASSEEVIQGHLVDMSEQGVRYPFPGASIDDIAAYLATLRHYSGSWWNAPAGSESGWGLSLSHQGDTIFAAWFTYDAAGRGTWLAMSAQKSGRDTYAGTFYTTRGPAFDSARYTVAQVGSMPVGSGTLTFADESNGSFEYNVDGVAQRKAITRYEYGPAPSCGAVDSPYELRVASNYQDLWWAAPAGSEAGWGIHLTHQGATLFATWFTYDSDGSPMWLVATAPRTGAGHYEGMLYRTSGPVFGAAHFDSAAVVATEVGRATLTFRDGNDATFAYSIGGVAQAKSITRQVFRASGTVCR